MSVIITFALSSVLIFIVVVGMALRARKRPVVSGLEQLLNAEAIVLDDFDQQGSVSVHSETWRAQTDTPLRKGQHVKVTGSKGLTLSVEPMDESTQEKSS
jgi:membrane-bound serine protease (ClpP class)